MFGERINRKSMAKKTVKEEKVVHARTGSVTAALRQIEAKFGEGSIMTLGEKPKVGVDAISSGSLGLDVALGVNGVPRGRIIEIFGPESSGKTTLALHIIAESQKKGGISAFIDAEHALDPVYAKRLGVQIDNLLVSQPDYGEQALEIAESLIRSGEMDVVVIDSVAALTPKDEIEGDMGAHHVGKQARLMSQALRKLTAIVAKSKTVVIFINQIRMQIGVMFGNPETTPGGKALVILPHVVADALVKELLKRSQDIILQSYQNREQVFELMMNYGSMIQVLTSLCAMMKVKTARKSVLRSFISSYRQKGVADFGGPQNLSPLLTEK
jgi:recombination protein RecA